MSVSIYSQLTNGNYVALQLTKGNDVVITARDGFKVGFNVAHCLLPNGIVEPKMCERLTLL